MQSASEQVSKQEIESMIIQHVQLEVLPGRARMDADSVSSAAAAILSRVTQTTIAYTPSADAGMLRELNLLREVEDAAADYCGRFMIDEAEDEDGSVCDEQQHLAAKRLCDALADLRAALNSQAHQIREGDRG